MEEAVESPASWDQNDETQAAGGEQAHTRGTQRADLSSGGNPPEVPAEEETPASGTEKRARELTEEEKRQVAYTPERLKPELVEKLSKDPNYPKLCMFCNNVPKLLAKKAEYHVPEQGYFKPCYVTFDNPMKVWDVLPLIAIGIHPVNNHSKQALWVNIPFSLDSDRVMGKLLLCGTRQELIDYTSTPECGPLFM